MTLRLIQLNASAAAMPNDVCIGDALLPLRTDDIKKENEDACSYLFKLCKRLDDSYLRRLGIECLFDVNGGWLSAKSCRIVGLIVSALVIDIAAFARTKPENGSITIKLDYWQSAWICSVSDNGVYSVRTHPSHPPEIAQHLVKMLNATLIRRETDDGGTTAFMFKANA